MDYGNSGDMDSNMDDMQPQQTGLPLWAYLANRRCCDRGGSCDRCGGTQKKKAAALAKLEEGNDEDI